MGSKLSTVCWTALGLATGKTCLCTRTALEQYSTLGLLDDDVMPNEKEAIIRSM